MTEESLRSPLSPHVRIAKRIKPGERGRAVMPFSEVCMHMRIAGSPMRFLLLQSPRGYVSVQLFEDGQPCGMCEGLGHDVVGMYELTCVYCEGTGWRRFSSPITTGEAGVYSDDLGFYFYGDVIGRVGA